MASPFDLARIQAETNLVSIDHHLEIGSTNDVAIDFTNNLSQASDLVFPRLILADHQTAGRGQRNRKWISSAGSLTLTLCIHSEARDDSQKFDRTPGAPSHGAASQSESRIDPAFGLFVGLGVCEAVDLFLDGEQLQLKWPNDVLLRGRKLAGILVEQIPVKFRTTSVNVPAHPGSVTIIGIGLNANNEPMIEAVKDESGGSLAAKSMTPPISLRTGLDRQFDLTSLTISIVNRVLEFHRSIPSIRNRLLEDCARRMIFNDREITVLLPSKQIVQGRFVGLTDLGELRLKQDQVEKRIHSGSIVNWE